MLAPKILRAICQCFGVVYISLVLIAHSEPIVDLDDKVVCHRPHSQRASVVVSSSGIGRNPQDGFRQRARNAYPPHWRQQRFRLDVDVSGGPRLRTAAKDRRGAIWKGPTCPGITNSWWGRRMLSLLERVNQYDSGNADGSGFPEERLEGMERIDRSNEDGFEAEQSDDNLPSKQRRQEGLEHPEFNPTGW